MNERLYRSRDDRVIAGVAAGVADMLNLDPSLVRILWVILAVVSGGIFVLLYIIMMIVVPEEPYDWPPMTASYGPPNPSPRAEPGWSPTGTSVPPPSTSGGTSPGPADSAGAGAEPSATTGGREGSAIDDTTLEDTTTMPAQDMPTTVYGPAAGSPEPTPGDQGAPAPPSADSGAIPGWDSTTQGSSTATPGWNAQAAGWTPVSGSGDWRSAREAERWARREQRRAWRATRRGRNDGLGAVIFGVLLILVGGFFLLRTYYPSIDTDRLWPIILVVIGVLFIIGSLRPGSGTQDR